MVSPSQITDFARRFAADHQIAGAPTSWLNEAVEGPKASLADFRKVIASWADRHGMPTLGDLASPFDGASQRPELKTLDSTDASRTLTPQTAPTFER